MGNAKRLYFDNESGYVSPEHADLNAPFPERHAPEDLSLLHSNDLAPEHSRSSHSGRILRRDPFTGADPWFEEEPILSDYRRWREPLPPPPMPGTDPNKQLHPARGTKTESMFVSPNILPTDDLWIKIAYLPHPITDSILHNFLLSLIPESTTRLLERMNATRLTIDQNWAIELDAIHSLEAGKTDDSIVQNFARGGIEGTSLPLIFSKYQHLAMSVLWAWGAPHNHDIPLSYVYGLTETVSALFSSTHRLSARIWYDFSADKKQPIFQRDWEKTASQKEKADAQPQIFKDSEWTWRHFPDSAALLANGLVDLIGMGGKSLNLCPNCSRIYWRPDDRKLFCNPNCSSTYNKRQERKGIVGGRRAEEKKKIKNENDRLKSLARTPFDPSDWR